MDESDAARLLLMLLLTSLAHFELTFLAAKDSKAAQERYRQEVQRVTYLPTAPILHYSSLISLPKESVNLFLDLPFLSDHYILFLTSNRGNTTTN